MIEAVTCNWKVRYYQNICLTKTVRKHDIVDAFEEYNGSQFIQYLVS